MGTFIEGIGPGVAGEQTARVRGVKEELGSNIVGDPANIGHGMRNQVQAGPQKAKLTPEQAQLGIAGAMQKNEEVAAKAAVFEVGQLVKVGTTNLRLSVARFAAKLGVVSEVDDFDNISVKLDGRNSFNAGTRVFEPTELEPA